MLKLPIYLDCHSTTPLDRRVYEAMKPYLTDHFGNAASRSHVFGWKADAAVEHARTQVAQLLGCSDKEIVFTSGATESNNLALKGVLEAYRSKGDHIVVAQTEHKSILDVCKHLELQRATFIEAAKATQTRWEVLPTPGARVTYLSVQSDGRLDMDSIAKALTDHTLLVSVMLANNEIGTLQDIAAIGRLCRERGILFHTDAAQGVGKVPFSVEEAHVDLASVSAHKLYGPKGVGALYVRRKPRVRVASIIDGGGHEKGMRSGTLNVAGIVGFGKACELARQEMGVEAERLSRLRDRLWQGLKTNIPRIWLNGPETHRLPGNLNVSFEDVESDALMVSAPDLAVSSGSACTSASVEPSYVLKACGVEDTRARGSIRFGLGRFTTEEEVDYAVRLIAEKVAELRALNPLAEEVPLSAASATSPNS